jgi:hypothetical protein
LKGVRDNNELSSFGFGLALETEIGWSNSEHKMPLRVWRWHVGKAKTKVCPGGDFMLLTGKKEEVGVFQE